MSAADLEKQILALKAEVTRIEAVLATPTWRPDGAGVSLKCGRCGCLYAEAGDYPELHYGPLNVMPTSPQHEEEIEEGKRVLAQGWVEYGLCDGCEEHMAWANIREGVFSDNAEGHARAIREAMSIAPGGELEGRLKHPAIQYLLDHGLLEVHDGALRSVFKYEFETQPCPSCSTEPPDMWITRGECDVCRGLGDVVVRIEVEREKP